MGMNGFKPNATNKSSLKARSLLFRGANARFTPVDQHQYDLTIFSVATDRYITYWSAMVDSYLKTNDPSVKIQWLVFTDRAEQINPELISRLGDSLLVSKIGHQEWPFPTLLRYQFFVSAAQQVRGRIVMHLDADMLFVGDINFSHLEKSLGPKGMGLISHPGYYRPAGIKKFEFYIKNLKYLAKDINTQLRFGGLGTWERNKLSMAYVPRSKRNNYVCGGAWLGQNAEIVKLCNILSARINEDLEQNVVAVFHDESHLNWYQANNSFNLLNPELCYDPSYPQLKGLTPRIIAVDKNAETKWIR